MKRVVIFVCISTTTLFSSQIVPRSPDSTATVTAHYSIGGTKGAGRLPTLHASAPASLSPQNCADWAKATFVDPDHGPQAYCEFRGRTRQRNQYAEKRCRDHSATFVAAGGTDKAACIEQCETTLTQLCQGNLGLSEPTGVGGYACLELNTHFLTRSSYCLDLSENAYTPEKTRRCQQACHTVTRNALDALPVCRQIRKGQCSGQKYDSMVYLKSKMHSGCAALLKEGCESTLGAKDPVVEYCKKISQWSMPGAAASIQTAEMPRRASPESACWEAIVDDCDRKFLTYLVYGFVSNSSGAFAAARAGKAMVGTLTPQERYALASEVWMRGQVSPAIGRNRIRTDVASYWACMATACRRWPIWGPQLALPIGAYVRPFPWAFRSPNLMHCPCVPV